MEEVADGCGGAWGVDGGCEEEAEIDKLWTH